MGRFDEMLLDFVFLVRSIGCFTCCCEFREFFGVSDFAKVLRPRFGHFPRWPIMRLLAPALGVTPRPDNNFSKLYSGAALPRHVLV